MAKKSIIQRNEKRKRLIYKYFTVRRFIKNNLTRVRRVKRSQKLKDRKYPYESIASRLTIYIWERQLCHQLQSLPRDSIPVRYQNRCWATGRGRAFYRDFGVSRHVLRELAHEGNIPGLTKSSW